MSLVATLKALAAAGGTPDQLIAVVEAHEASRTDALAQRRAADAARQKRRRHHVMSRDGHVTERDVNGVGTAVEDLESHVMSRDGHVTSRESRDPSPRVPAGDPREVISFSSSLRSEEVGGAGGECARASPPGDWPDGDAQHQAKLLCELVASPWLDRSKSPDLVGTAGRLVAWRRDGASWEHDVIPVVTKICVGRRSRIASWKYFDEAIARSIADNRRALEIPLARPSRRSRPTEGWTAVDQALAVIAAAENEEVH